MYLRDAGRSTKKLPLFSLVITVLLTGCSTFKNPVAPEQSFDVNADIIALEQEFAKPDSIKNYYAGTPSVDARNKLILGRLVLINIHYIEFVKKFAVTKAQLDSAFEISTIGVDLAGVLVGSAATKSILAAISGGLTSSKVTIEKNFFQQKTVPVLITTMNAARKESLAPILRGMKGNITEYPLATAISDLQVYYHSGTFLGALQAIQKEAGIKEASADKVIQFERTGSFASSINQARIRSILSKIDNISDATAISLISNPPVANAQGLKIIDLRDPTNQRATNGAVARSLLKTIAVLSKRDPADLDAWDAAVSATQ